MVQNANFKWKRGYFDQSLYESAASNRLNEVNKERMKEGNKCLQDLFLYLSEYGIS